VETSPTFDLARDAEFYRRAVARLARTISILLSPPLLSLASLAMIAATLNTTEGWRWAGLEMGLSVIVPSLFVGWLVCTGRVADFDLQVRAQRTGPYIVTLLCLSCGWLVARAAGAPDVLSLFTGAVFVQMALLMAITLVWKISLHSAAIAGLVTLVWIFHGSVALLALPLAPLVIWSRL
jgi:hypothetical protein